MINSDTKFYDENNCQIASIDEALGEAADCFSISSSRVGRNAKAIWKARAYAYLNRACELACVPLAQYYIEVPSGVDLAWITYRPEAIANSPDTDPAALIYLGSVDNLTEDEARSRAIGY